jgi:NTF2 fold immunity protein
LIAISFVGCATQFNYHPKEGYVPDATAASRIAEAVWIPIYGEKTIFEERPYRAKRIGNLWYVEGSLRSSTDPKELIVGGVAEITIDAKSGKILRVSHGK